MTNQNITLFTVPVGYRVVITDLHGYVSPADAARVDLFSTSTSIPILRVHGTGTSTEAHWSGRVVLHELESCKGQYAGGTNDARFQLSGWLLTGAGGPLTPGTMPA